MESSATGNSTSVFKRTIAGSAEARFAPVMRARGNSSIDHP
jgi:hypothetical protein